MARRRTESSESTSPTTGGVVEFKTIKIDDLRFDETNPRVVERLGNRPTQKQIHDLLLAEEARELVPSFMANGYLPYEPLIVRPASGQKFSVLEGNRRLAAIRSMKDSDDDEEKRAFQERHLNELPCLVFKGDETAALAYLGLRHLSKTKDWSPSAKASFVERVMKSGKSIKETARMTNTTGQSLRQLLMTRRLFEKAIELGIDLPAYSVERDLLFWHLGDAVRRNRTKSYLRLKENEDPLQQPEVDDRRLEKLVGWIYGNPKTGQVKIITNIRDIPNLDLCLGSAVSANALEAGASIQEALEAGEAAGARVSAHIDRAKASLQRATGGLTDIEQEAMEEVRQARASLQNAIKAFDREFVSAGERFQGQ